MRALILSIFLVFSLSIKTFADTPQSPESPKDPTNPFAESFLMPADMRIGAQPLEFEGLLFVEKPNRTQNTNYAVVTGFKDGVMKTRAIPGLQSPQDVHDWIKKNSQSVNYGGVEIKQLTFDKPSGEKEYRYWVGNKSFETPNVARSQITMTKTVTEMAGQDFSRIVNEAPMQLPVIEKIPDAEVKIENPARYLQEEEIILKYMDALKIGDGFFGPLQGEQMGEPMTWQSFGETSWRQTNLESPNYSDQTGYWTNRIVFKGIKFPLSTIDAYVEATAAMESDGVDYKDNLKLWAGLEWRPFSRMAFLENFRPGGDIPILIWIRNYRFYVQYGDRLNLKGRIENSRNYDIEWGTQIFYEWGIDLPPIDEPSPSTTSDYLRKYSWGEYYGHYYVTHTNFSAEDDYDSVILNSSLILGVHLPGIPLPKNSWNNEFALMPYVRLEHTNNTEFSTPSSNQYFVSVGVRWMPFRTYPFKHNEWLAKTKIFAEYLALGGVQHSKQDKEAPYSVDRDLRFGVSISQNRY